MKTIIVASENPVKINSTLRAFERVFPNEAFQVEGISVPSGVPDQPLGEEETLRGASNRAQAAMESRPDANFWVGLEGGLIERGDELYCSAWMVVRSKELTGKATTGSFPLPSPVAKLVREGLELADADARVFARANAKQTDGTVGKLTHSAIDRTEYYEHALVLALIPFLNKELYRGRVGK